MLSTMRYPPETGNATSILLLRANAMMPLVPNVVAASNVPANATNLRRVTPSGFWFSDASDVRFSSLFSDVLQGGSFCSSESSYCFDIMSALSFRAIPLREGNLKIYYEQTAIPTYPCKAKYMGQTFGIYGLAIEWRILLGE